MKKTALLPAIIFLFVLFFNHRVVAQSEETSKNSSDDTLYYEFSDTSVTVNNQTTNVDESVLNQINQLQSSIGELSPENLEKAEQTTAILSAISDNFSLVSALPALPLLLTLLPLLLSPNLLILFLSAVLSKKKRYSGIIYDFRTKKPVSMAIIKAYQHQTTKFVGQKISDLDGRYSLPLSGGRYRIQVMHPNYETFIKDIEIIGREESFAEDIGLSTLPYNYGQNFIARVFKDFRIWAYKNSLVVSIIGLLLSLVAYYFNKGTLESLLLIFYVVMIGTYLFAKYILSRKNNWGLIVDSSTNLRIAGAIVRLYSDKNILQDTQIADGSGRFGFLLKPGKYFISCYINGYSFPSVLQNRPKVNSELKMVETNVVSEGWADFKILMDPVLGQSNNYENKFAQVNV